MYFTSYQDYKSVQGKLRSEIVHQGWQLVVSRNETLGMNISSYRPSIHDRGALYNDDPADAAGMAMMTSALQHSADQTRMLSGYINRDAQMYAEGKARAETSTSGRLAGIPAVGMLGGIGENIGAGITALGANFNSGVAAKWSTAGHPVVLVIDGKPARQSVNAMMTSATFTEQAYVIDDTSGNIAYPTEMDVRLSLVNMYGSLLTATSEK